jgi:hypothetical protein
MVASAISRATAGPPGHPANQSVRGVIYLE